MEKHGGPMRDDSSARRGHLVRNQKSVPPVHDVRTTRLAAHQLHPVQLRAYDQVIQKLLSFK